MGDDDGAAITLLVTSATCTWWPQFACPEGLDYLSASNPKGKSHSLSSFVFTDQDGGRQYGYCLHFFEPMNNLPSMTRPCRMCSGQGFVSTLSTH